MVAARARDMAVDVHAAGHDDHAARIERRCAGGQVRHDPPIGDADVTHFAVDAVRGVVDRAPDDAERGSRGHAAASRRRSGHRILDAPSTIAAVRGPSSAAAAAVGCRPAGRRCRLHGSGATGIDRDVYRARCFAGRGTHDHLRQRRDGVQGRGRERRASLPRAGRRPRCRCPPARDGRRDTPARRSGTPLRRDIQSAR